MKTNVLYFGDNLEILRNREYFPDECADLIYLDPPFNSKKDYNILFKENSGIESEVQIKAFTDTWHWTQAAENTYHDIVVNGPLNVGKLIGALHDAIGHNDVMAYLVMMTARLIEMHRVLKPTGALYLHCDPTASHYLKLVLDQIFGPTKFRNEIIWHYEEHGTKKKCSLPKGHETILYYSKSDSPIWHPPFKPYSDRLLRSLKKDEKGWYYTRGQRTGRRALADWEKETKVGLKTYVDLESGGTACDTVWHWNDVGSYPKAGESMGYETQKPLSLLERIIKASSNEKDVVLDPFCGCGTALIAAQKLKRRWIGIDITHLAINLMRNRLRDTFKIKPEVIGEPVDLSGAKALAHEDRYQFQYWACGLIGARPLGEKKKGADKGIDGVIQFIDSADSSVKRVVVQVKSGHVGVNAIRELKAVAANEAIGVFLTLEPPTEPMKVEAIDAGFYHSPIWKKDYTKIQIITVEELLKGKTVDMPPQEQTSVTYTKAKRISTPEGEQLSLGD